MNFLRTEQFKKDFAKLPEEIQLRFEKALQLFASHLHHPSLHVKKMEGALGIWELRVTDNYRVTFQMNRHSILLRRIGSHNILRTP